MMPADSKFRLSVVLLALVLVAPLMAQEINKPPRLFSDNDEMNVTFSGPWRSIRNNIKKDALYPAQLTYEFRGNKSLKLVTYCNTRSKYEQYYIKEFLVYRIYNLITGFSFRVRPLFVEYKDSQSSKFSTSRFSFLIEDLDRNNINKLTIPQIKYKTLDPVEISKFSLFQFMVGNVDFSSVNGPEGDRCCHNTKLIGAHDTQVPRYSIPYDFDSTGLVDAHYAYPPEALKLRNIRQRKYRGFCFANDQLPDTIALFNQKKPAILGLFKNDVRLNDNNRRKAIKYIEAFYKIINDPRELKAKIIDQCRGSAL
jgi:hypothetical protein